MKWILTITLTLVFLFCWGCHCGPQLSVKEESHNHGWNSIFIHDVTGWRTLGELEFQARSYLLARSLGFSNSPERISIWIENGSTSELLSIHYNSGLGRPYWTVVINKAGQVMNATNGILGEAPITGEFK